MHTSSAAAHRRSNTGLVCLVTSGVLWGTGGLFGSLLTTVVGLSPLAVAAYRLLLGGAIIAVFLMLSRRPLPRGRAAWTRLIMIAGLSALFQGCYFGAVRLTSVSLATLTTIAAGPVLMLATEQITGRGKVNRWMIATIALSLAGLALLVGLPSGGFAVTAVLGSAGLSLLAAAGFVAVTLLGAHPIPALDDLATTGISFTIGGLLLAPAAEVTTGMTFHPSLASLGLLLGLATAPTAVAYTLYFRGLRSVNATVATIVTLLEPLTAAVLGAYLLGDQLGITGMTGALILAVAVVVAPKAQPSMAN
ncbi:EamA family transporter [Nocardia sp. SYP-A9097]|uniref:DMT family transporter n=1 Tax=Nocardia sp. SYP-A9097 TaxID=2663237 RepID=UPI00129B9F76|nr:DMT family transporter [Nocardia sp. SYP-A9097]MRH92187.1 EamA family transporter [Nocardia sp. SYP-A9097]